MMKKRLIALLGAFLAFVSLSAMQIGEWRLFRSSNEIEEVEVAGPENACYVLASGSLVWVDEKGESLSLSKGSPLSDNDIVHIAWCAEVNRLLVVYEDGNLDLLDKEGNVINLPDYMNKPLAENKAINGTVVKNGTVFLVTSFAVIEVNMKEACIGETYSLDTEVAKWVLQQPFQRTDVSMLPAEFKGMGPRWNTFFHVSISNNLLYAAPGLYFGSLSLDKSRPGGVQVMNLETEEWRAFDDSFASSLGHRYVDNEWVLEDPLNPDHVMVGGKSGLYEFVCDTLYRHYHVHNSPLRNAIGTKSGAYCMVEAMTYDEEGNLWFANTHVMNSHIFCMKARKNLEDPVVWDSISFYPDLKMDGLNFMQFDRHGYLWVANSFWNNGRAVCLDLKKGGSQAFLIPAVNQHGSSFSERTEIRCVEEDLEGNYWFGTSVGPVYIKQTQLYSGDQTLNQYVVPRNDGSGLGDYLLKDIGILDIYVDVMGRKWFATQEDGIYVVSADNNTQIAHYTKDNSLLPHNRVYQIYPDQETGRFYFTTDEGLAVLQTEAMAGAKSNKEIYCYPNPVRSNFTGKLTIRGLKENSSVRITDVRGSVVYQTTALSGTVQWDLCVDGGDRVSPGIYIIHAIEEDGKDGGTTKVLVQ